MAPPDRLLNVDDLAEARRPLTCPLLDRELLWATGATPDLAAGGMLVELAPAGRYQPVSRDILPWSDLEDWEVEPAPEQIVGRTLWRRANPRPPERPLELLPPRIAGDRPLLLAEAPAPRPWGRRALEDASGARLAVALGTTLGGLLASCETANLLAAPDEQSAPALRRLERDGTLAGRVVVLIGSRTAELVGDVGRFGGILAGVVIHPSGDKNPRWNFPGEANRSRGVILDSMVATRGREGIDADLALARLGRWGGWQGLGDLGVAAHSPTPGHAWRPGPISVDGRPAIAWSRRWAGGEATIRASEAGVDLTLEAGTHWMEVRDVASVLEAVATAETFIACHGREVAGAPGGASW
jgi:hypothetical protein